MFSQGYIIDSQVCIAVLYLFYITLLHRRVTHRAARAYLVTMLPVALLLPIVSLPLLPAPVMASIPNVEYEELVQYAQPVVTTVNYLMIVYLIGVGVMAAWIICGAVKLTILLRRSLPERIVGLKVVFANQKISAYSVFDYIFVSTALRRSGLLHELLAHEECHIRLHHTLDLIYMSIVRTILWFNPMVWHTGSLLRQVHEYQADENVLSQGYSTDSYINLLIMSETGLNSEFASPFSYALTKKRLTMLAKQQQIRSRRRLLLILPILVLLLSAFSVTTRAAVEIVPNASYQRDTTLTEEFRIRSDSSKTPLFFVDGKEISHEKLNDINHNNIASVAVFKTPPAIEKYGDRSKNGVIEIKTKAIADKRDANTSDKTPGFTSHFMAGRDEAPLLIIDGVESENGINAVNPEQIAQISVLEDNDATTRLYGDRAKNGVIILTTKGNGDKNTQTSLAQANNSITDKVIHDNEAPLDMNDIVVVKYGTLKKADEAEYYYSVKTTQTTGTVTGLPGEKREQTASTKIAVMPKFQNGDISKFRAWVQGDINYPAQAIARRIEGQVLVQFVIEKDGSLSNISVSPTANSLLSKEAVRIIKKSPKWTPGYNANGTNERVLLTCPIEFKLMGACGN